jgi:hypothetical protein
LVYEVQKEHVHIVYDWTTVGSHEGRKVLEIGEMVISAFIGLIGLGPASRVFTCSLLDRLLFSNNQYINMPPYDLVLQQKEVKSLNGESSTSGPQPHQTNSSISNVGFVHQLERLLFAYG